MKATIIGIGSGIITVILLLLFKRIDKKYIYGLALTGIGFLYVGFTWSDTKALIMNIIQAIFFLLLAYYGLKKNLYYLIVGYFLHGVWDLIYDLFANANLLPPHYDLFCMTYDFIIGFYLLIYKNRLSNKII